MHFVREGAGAPPIVFVHGFACALDDWRAQLAHFAPRHEVVACDLRGHGATPGQPQECTIANYGGDLAALLANLELQGAVLVGHSMGCRVVLEAARLDPARVAGLVLVDGSLFGLGDPTRGEAVIGRMKAAPSFAAFADGMFSEMFLAPSEASRTIVARAKAMPAATGAALFEDLVRWDVAHMGAALAAVRAPLMAVQTTWVNVERKRAPLQAGQSTPWLDVVRAAVPAARIEVIANAGHFPQVERAGELNALVGSFVAGLA